MSNKINRDKTCRECNKTFTATLEKHPLLGWPERPSAFKENKFGTCKACSEAGAEKRIHREKMKHLFWTPETIKKHFEKHIPIVGQKLILLYTGYIAPDEVSYTLVEVESVQIKPSRKLIINAAPPHGGCTFNFSGKNTWSPTGQSLLLPYHKALGGHIAAQRTPASNEKEHPVELLISLEELTAILGDQEGPTAD